MNNMNNIFEAVVLAINDIETEYGIQKEIVVGKNSNETEKLSEFIALPPATIPIDPTGSGFLSLPSIGQRCLVIEIAGHRRVQILTYLPFSGSTQYGEYVPELIESGQMIMKVGGLNSASLSLSKNGKVSIYSNEFSRMSLDGNLNEYQLSTLTLNESTAGSTTKLIMNEEEQTSYIKVITSNREWKQNSDILLSLETTPLFTNSVIPLPDYSYTSKVIIKSGTILNEFDSSIGKEQGHLYQIETRQAIKSNFKNTVSVLKLGFQNEMVRYNDSIIYPEGTMFEWSGKNVINNKANTYLHRYGLYEKDIIENSTSKESVSGEIYRNQIYKDYYGLNIVSNVNDLAEGQGYDFEINKNSAAQQYLVSYGALNSQNLINNSEFLYNSAVRISYHNYKDHNLSKIENFTGVSYNYILDGETSTENLIFKEQFRKTNNGIENFSKLEQFSSINYINKLNFDNKSYLNLELKENSFKNEKIININNKFQEIFENGEYLQEFTINSANFKIKFTENEFFIEFKGENENSPKILFKQGEIQISPGNLGEKIYLGEENGLQKLVTESWVRTYFDNHIHPTSGPGGPTLKPIPLPSIPEILNSTSNVFTYKVKAE